LTAQIILAIGVALLTRRPRGALFLDAPARDGAAPPARRDWVCIALAAGVGAALVLSGIQQAITPVWGADEGMYHGPRIAYWIQYRSVLFFTATNDRQVVFPYGADLVAAWPLLFVKQEVLARMAFWLTLPASAAGMYLVCRTLGLSRRAALGAVLLFVATPTV